MVHVRHLMTAFFGGEIDPLMSGRVDTENYGYGLETCENFVPINEGPLVKRPGFEFIRDADATSTWLTAFRFSISQEYVIEWGNLKTRWYTNGVRIETSPGVAYELTTPYTAAQAPDLSTQQSYDRLYVDHAAHPPARISRTSAVTFSYEVSPIKNGPFLDANTDENITVTVSDADGSGTLSASSGIFTADMVGGLFRIEAKDFSDMKAWEPGMAGIVVNEMVRSDGKAYRALAGTKTGTNQPIHTSGAEWDGQDKQDVLNTKGPYAVKWEYVHDRFGIVKITGFTSATQVTYNIVKRLPDSVTSVATWRWAHGAWSNAKGWPSLVIHWAGRQIHFKDFDIHGSVVGDFLNHATQTTGGQITADLAFRRTIATEDPPLWVAGDRKLLVGTASKELAIGAINNALAVSGDNVAADPQSFYGSERVFPAQIGTQTIFVERGGRRLRASGYDFGQDRYAAIDLTAAARHITKPEVIQLAWQRVPYALLYGVRADGQMIVHAQTRLDIKGFARTVPGGDNAKILSAVSVVGEDAKTDELWVLITRNTPAGTRREIWRQTSWRDIGDAQEESFFVDAGVKATASAGQTHFSGLTHLANQDVAVLANGAVVLNQRVSSTGTLDIPADAVPDYAYTIVIGLPYTAKAATLRPELRPNGQTSQGMRQRVVKVMMRMLETLGLKVGDPDGPLEEVIDRPGNAPQGKAIPLFSGDSLGQIDAAFDRDGKVVWQSSDPLPAVITAAMLSIDLDQKDV